MPSARLQLLCMLHCTADVSVRVSLLVGYLFMVYLKEVILGISENGN